MYNVNCVYTKTLPEINRILLCNWVLFPFLQIPYIQKAMSVSPKKILMFGSPWSAPAWMKTDHNMTSNGSLIGQPGGQYYETWARYFVK